jgi:hypothetical protein
MVRTMLSGKYISIDTMVFYGMKTFMVQGLKKFSENYNRILGIN